MATEEIEVNFRLDANGRTSKSGDGENEQPVMDYSSKTAATTFSQNDAAVLDELLLDAEIADSGLLPRTFWLSTNCKPRCSFEQMALDVFRHHTADCSFQPETSGAEWWVQLRPSPSAGRYSMHDRHDDDGDDDDEKDLSKKGISLHWDKDEDLRILCGGTTYVHPHISTVTYLTSIGAPTFAVNCRVHNLTGQYIIPGQDTGDASAPEAFISWPAAGKHLSFDGRYLHAAPPNLMEKGAFDHQCKVEEPSKDQPSTYQKTLVRRHRRVTFLVNVWLNYHPFDVKPFPDSMIDKMSGKESPVNLQFPPDKHAEQSSVRIVTIQNGQAKEATHADCMATQFVWPMGDRDCSERLEVSIPLEAVRQQAEQGGNVRVQWSLSLGLNPDFVIRNDDELTTEDISNKRPRLGTEPSAGE
jgi:hypothetical protein